MEGSEGVRMPGGNIVTLYEAALRGVVDDGVAVELPLEIAVSKDGIRLFAVEAHSEKRSVELRLLHEYLKPFEDQFGIKFVIFADGLRIARAVVSRPNADPEGR